MTVKALPHVFFCAFLFGSTLVASRFSIGEFDALAYITIRLVIASASYLLIYLVDREHSLPRDPTMWFRAGIMGVFGTAVNQVSIVYSLKYLSAGTSSVLMALTPAATIIMAQVLLPDERLKPYQWGGIALAFSGAVMLATSGENGLADASSADPRGYILVLITIIAVSTTSIYARIYLREYPSLEVASIRIFSATLVLIPVALMFSEVDFGAISREAYTATLYAALAGSFGAFFSQLFLIQRFGAVPAALVSYTIPIFAGIGGIVVLGETISLVLVSGFLMILAGILLTQTRHNPAA